jgi:hypothetical protein
MLYKYKSIVVCFNIHITTEHLSWFNHNIINYHLHSIKHFGYMTHHHGTEQLMMQGSYQGRLYHHAAAIITLPDG